MPIAIEKKTPRQLHSEQTRASIVRAAMSIIREHGIERATVSNICRVAGVTNGSFYHYFNGKDEVLAQYLSEAFEQRADEFDRIAGDDVVENIVRYYELYNAFLVDQGLDFIRSFYSNTNKGLYSHRNYLFDDTRNVPLMRTIERILHQARENGYLAPHCDIMQLTHDMSMIEKGVVFDWCLSDGEYDLSAEMTRMLKNYLCGGAVSERYLQQHPINLPAANSAGER